MCLSWMPKIFVENSSANWFPCFVSFCPGFSKPVTFPQQLLTTANVRHLVVESVAYIFQLIDAKHAKLWWGSLQLPSSCIFACLQLAQEAFTAFALCCFLHPGATKMNKELDVCHTRLCGVLAFISFTGRPLCLSLLPALAQMGDQSTLPAGTWAVSKQMTIWKISQ